jgi:cytoskeletal protein RodZ
MDTYSRKQWMQIRCWPKTPRDRCPFLFKEQREIMETTRLTRFNRKVLQKKTRLLGLTIAQLTILAVVMSGGTAALIVTHHQSMPTTTPNTITSESDNPSPKSYSSTSQLTPPQSTNSTQSNTSKPNASSDAGSTLDKYGCATNIPSHDQCVKNAIVLWCNSQISQPALDFNNATLQARSAYNTVMNEWQIEQYKTPHSPYSEYLTDATNKFNAIYEPAYSTYTAKVQSLKSQGCSLQYPSHESPG